MPSITREVHVTYDSAELTAAVQRYLSEQLGVAVAVDMWAHLATDYDDYFFELWLALDNDLPEERVEAVARFLETNFGIEKDDIDDLRADRMRVTEPEFLAACLGHDVDDWELCSVQRHSGVFEIDVVVSREALAELPKEVVASPSGEPA